MKQPDCSADIVSLTPFVHEHGRVFDLSVLKAAIGQTLGTKVATVIGQHFARLNRKTAVTRWSAFRRYWEWVATAEQVAEFRKTTKRAGRIVSRHDLETVTHLWFDDYESKARVEPVTVGENVNHLGRCLDVLAEQGVIPRIARLKMPPNYHRGAKRRKSFAEVTANSGRGQVDSVLGSIRETISDFANIAGGDEYLEALASCADASDLNSTQELVKAIQSLNAARLKRVRDIAEEKLLHCHRVFQEGQALRKAGGKDLAPYIQAYIDPAVSRRTRGNLRAEAFGGYAPENLEKLKRSFVRYVHEHCGGVCPKEGDFPGGRSLFLKLARTMGGRNYIKGWFGAQEDAVAAAAIIYLIDSGANISVVLGFTLSWEEPCDEPGHVRISGIKVRPADKPIVEILPVLDRSVRVSAVEALRMLKVMTDPYRRQDKRLSDVLFVHAFFSPVPLDDEVLASRLGYFCRDDPVLKNVKLLPSYIRPSVLLQVTLDRDGSVLAARALADHGPDGGVTEGYTMRYPTRVLYAAKIREFQELFQISVVYDIRGACAALGISQRAARTLLKTAERTGLGFSCKNPKAGVQPGTKTGKTCGKVENCLSCQMFLFHASLENLADLILFREHLKRHQAQWESEREERWNQVWLPYLAFAETVLEKIRRGPYAALLSEARQLANQWKVKGLQLLPLF